MSKLRVLLTFLCILLIFPDGVMAAEQVHGSCSDCHGEGNALKTAPVTLLCLTCHPSRRSDHPLVTVPASMTTTLPVDDERKMTCLTCHNPHESGDGKKLLRKPKEALCQDCHQK